jgi:hypothetical protein
METALTFLGKDVFEDKLRAKQDEVATAAQNAGRTFTQSMAELSQMQQAEILRLQNILRDNTAVPERHPVQVSVHTSADKNGFPQHSFVAIASDRSMWVMQNFKPGAGRHGSKWDRVPTLPQVADEVDSGS